MAKITIKGTGYNIRDYEILVEDTPIRGLLSLAIQLEGDYLNEATITFAVEEIYISAETLVALEAFVKQGEKDET